MGNTREVQKFFLSDIRQQRPTEDHGFINRENLEDLLSIYFNKVKSIRR